MPSTQGASSAGGGRLLNANIAGKREPRALRSPIGIARGTWPIRSRPASRERVAWPDIAPQRKAPPMILYENRLSPYAFKVRVLLAESGVEFESKSITTRSQRA